MAQPMLSDARRNLLEKYLQGDFATPSQELPPIVRRTPRESASVSYGQQQVWLHAQMAPNLPLYNEPVTIHRIGPLGVPALERAFNEIVRRHEAWRTSFQTVDGQPVQVVHPPPYISLPVSDLRSLPEAVREAEALKIATEDSRVPLDMASVPLFRVRLIRLGDEEHRLFLTLSHIIFDGVAIYRVFLPELAALYEAFAAGKPSPMPDLPIQYADYAEWQRRVIAPAALADNMAYWRKQLAGPLPVLELPVDRSRRSTQTFRGSMHPFVLESSLAAAVKSISQRQGVTRFMTLLATFAAILHRYSGQDDILIGTVTAGRKHCETEKLLGYFLNTVMLRIDLSGDPSFRELLSRVREVTLEALAHDDVPFAQLVRELQPKRQGDRSPLFQVMFSLEPPMASLDPAWQLTQMDVDTGATKYDVYLELDERPEGILARFHYSTDLFDAATIARMEGHWRTMIEAAVADPARRISDLPLLTESERAKFQAQWPAMAQPYPESTIHALFEAQAKRSPHAIAVAVGDRQLTYSELNRRANQLAWYLQKRGVGPDVLVALCMERSLEMVVGLLGILKAGGAYLPLDPDYPQERLALVLSDARPRVLLTQQTLRPRLPSGPEVVLLDASRKAIEHESAENPSAAAGPANLAYVIYTSGSTGIPKGVQIEHRSVVNFLTSMQREPGLSREDVLVAVTTLSFDIAGLEIYLPLITGAQIVLARPEVSRDGTRLIDLLRRSKATVMQATPATWRLLLEAGWPGSPGLKVLCGGEAMAPELACQLTERGQTVWNLYGPTETTIWSAAYRVNGQDDGVVPIGRPIANTQICVLDSHLQPVPAGVRGEIYIGGDGVARGYLDRPELTAERFIANPFCGGAGARLYKTGDLGRYLADGNLECLGRVDHQVKLRGFRIELGEIESVLGQHPSVREAAAGICDDASGEKRLVAYCVTKGQPGPSSGALRAFLRKKLPDYMVPSSFVSLDALPLTPNGKLDRGRLRAPEQLRNGADGAHAIARDELETQLTEIWEQVLAVKPIGIRDDFFDLGGHSLLAVRLFALIEKSFGKKIPLATLFQAPTIEQLADVLRERKTRQSSSLVPIQPHGSLPPLFCVHGHMGEVLFYRPLSQCLGPNQPFFALQAQEQIGLPAHHTIEAMAADYLTEIRTVQSHGPYFIGGYCFGGRVAFEMAQQLVKQGEKVAFLGLFMSYDPNLFHFPSRIKSHLEQFRLMRTTAKLADLTRNSAEKMRSVLWRLMFHLLKHRLSPGSRLFRNVSEMNLQAVRDYAPTIYPGRMTAFLNGRVPAGLSLDPDLRLFGMGAHEVQVRVFPGDGDSMFHEPFVRRMAEQLRTCLKDAATLPPAETEDEPHPQSNLSPAVISSFDLGSAEMNVPQIAE